MQLTPQTLLVFTRLYTRACHQVCRVHTGEVQACADAASERVQALETQLDTQSTDAEAAAAAAQAELESTQADAASMLITIKAELKASLEAAETELVVTKVALFAPALPVECSASNVYLLPYLCPGQTSSQWQGAIFHLPLRFCPYNSVRYGAL